MKKENLQIGLAGIILMIACFYAGYSLSPINRDLDEQKAKIEQMEEIIVQQQTMYFYLIKELPQFKIHNWSMNKIDKRSK